MRGLVLDGQLHLKHRWLVKKAFLNLNSQTEMNKKLKNSHIAVIMITWLKLLLIAITDTLHHSLKTEAG